MPTPEPSAVVAPVKSGWFSKINWTQIGGLLASLAALIGLNVDPQTLTTIVVGIQALIAVVTMVMRTFFTTSVTAASAVNMKTTTTKP